MNQLLLFAVIGIGIVGMSVGFASNTIALNVQQLGVGEDFITSPISAADVDFELLKVHNPGNDQQLNTVDDYFANIITGCSFHSKESIRGPALVICKLTDDRNPPKNGVEQFGKVIAEGRLALANGYQASNRIVVPISQVAYLEANDVQNIHDVKIVVQGADPTVLPGCTVENDAIIDADGINSPAIGSTIEVQCGDPLSMFPVSTVVGQGSGLDMFDNDASGTWTTGLAGDDLHSEGTFTCATAIRDGVHQLGTDCKVLDLDSSLSTGQLVTCDLEFAASISGLGCTGAILSTVKWFDGNADGKWDSGEDIVFDANSDGIFD